MIAVDGEYLTKGYTMRSIDRCCEHRISSPDKPFTDRLESTPVSLDWLCQIVWRKWPIILSLCVLGGLCGAIIAFISPQYWKATALIEIGEVANEPLESTSYTIDQLRDPAFSDILLEHLKQTETEEVTRYAKRSIADLQVRELRGANLIEVTIDGPSKEAAMKMATTIFNYLRSFHFKKYDILANSLRSRYEEIISNISKIKADQVNLHQLNKTLIVSTEEEGLTEKLLLVMLATTNDTQLRELNKELFVLQQNLLPVSTFNTKLVTTIHVTETPTFPSIPIFVAGGALITLFLGLVWLIISRSNSALASDLS